jgi:hypothetical protein
MSGLSRTPGKRVRVNSPPRVRIPPSPPIKASALIDFKPNGLFYIYYFLASSDLNQPPTVSLADS